MVVAYRRGLARFLLAIVVICIGGTAQGQLPQYLLEPGAPTFVTPEAVPMGFINVANGNLHIEIPLGVVPQRGGRSFIAKFVYDSRVWKIVDNGSSQSWQPTNLPSSTLLGRGWRFVATASLTAQSDTVIHDCGPDNWYEYRNYRLQDESGTIRRFPLHYETTVSCHTAGPTTASGPSLDATGVVMNREATTYQVKDVIAPDGTTVWNRAHSGNNYLLWKDPNGNFMEQQEDPETEELYALDTLDRRIVEIDTSGTPDVYEIMNANFNVFVAHVTGLATNFGVSGVTEWSGSFTNEIQTIDGPGGTYQFTYESTGSNKYGLLKTMTLPTGEVVTFTYTNFTDTLGKKNRWVNSVNRSGGTWTYTPATCGTNCNKVTVTRPSGDETVYTFTLDSGGNGAWNTMTKNHHGSATGGTLALTLQHDYDTSLTNPTNGGADFVRRTRTTTTWPGPAGDLVSKVEDTYDTFSYNYQGTNYTGRRGNVLTHKEFAYGSGSAGGLVREQVFTYLHDADANYIPKNIVNRVTNVQTKNAAGTKIAEMTTSYDSTSLTSVAGVTNHDDSNFGTGFTLRGSPTVIQRWTGSGYLSTTHNYDTTGQVLSTSDPKGNVVQFSYTNNFYSGTYPPMNAYVTGVTLPVSGTLSHKYHYFSGKVSSSTDQNAKTTSFQYGSMGQPTKRTMPGGSFVENQFTTPTQLDHVATGDFNDRHTITPSSRTSKGCVQSDPEGPVCSTTTYDTSGRVQLVTNPFRSPSDPTWGSTTYQYDGLSRVTRLTLQDGNYQEAFYGSGVGAAGGRTTQLCAGGTYGLGYPTLSKDETGKKRQNWVDAFGLLIEADEPDATGALTLGTCYKYDVLGNLIQVDQGSQTRTNTHDALSRLTAATTPEAGTVNYFYTTAGGALCSGNPKAPCRVTDARNITTTYAYDAENRLTGKTYSNGDPAVSYFYDQLQRTDHHQRKGTAHGHERRLRPVGLELRQRRPYPDRAAHHRRDHQEPRVLLQRERRSDDSHLSERSGD